MKRLFLKPRRSRYVPYYGTHDAHVTVFKKLTRLYYNKCIEVSFKVAWRFQKTKEKCTHVVAIGKVAPERV